MMIKRPRGFFAHKKRAMRYNNNGATSKSNFSINESKISRVYALIASSQCFPCLPLAVILTIFSLAMIHERHMDQLHFEHQKEETRSILDNNSSITSHPDLDNGWIPNSQVIEFTKLKESGHIKGKTLYNKDISEDHKYSKSKAYKPSLTTFPITLLRNLTTSSDGKKTAPSKIEPTDIIFFWHIPKAAGSTLKQIFTSCFHLTRAHLNPRFSPSDEILIHGTLNMDTSTVVGIARAKDASLLHDKFDTAEKRLVPNYIDVIVSSHLHEGRVLFTADSPTDPNSVGKGRLVSFFRHPIEREVSLFYYLGRASWERYYHAQFQNMTLLEYARGTQDGSTEYIVDNWMTRYLARNLRGRDVTEEDFQLAKDILESKCLVGLVEEMEESWNRIVQFFGLHDPPPWIIADDVTGYTNEEKSILGMDCVRNYNREEGRVNVNTFKSRIKKRPNDHDEHEKEEVLKEGNEVWNLLARKNEFDLRLFQFVKEKLWVDQGVMLASAAVAGIDKTSDSKAVNNHTRWNYRPKPMNQIWRNGRLKDGKWIPT